MQFRPSGFTHKSDQLKQLPQPPVFKSVESEITVDLPVIRKEMLRENGYLELLKARHTRRNYTNQGVTLEQLSFLLWSTQGVKEYREGGARTGRPVPSGGARHPFETYVDARNVQGLEPGLWHYSPDKDRLEFLRASESFEEDTVKNLCGQVWTARSAAVFYWTCVAYRAEWRYSWAAHRVALIDLGHVDQNFYLSAEALGLGACAIAAFDQDVCDPYLGVDGTDEYTVLTATLGVPAA